MNKLLISAAALAILSAPVAYADDNDNNNRQQGQHEKANKDDNAPDRSNDRGAKAAKPDAGPGGGAMSSGNDNKPNRNAGDNDKPNRDANDNDRVRDRNNNNNDKDRVRGNDNDNNKTVINKTVVRKTVDRSTVLKFRANIRAPHRYHVTKIYVRPAGFYPHRWVFGERLPRAFFAPDYFILDFSTYGLIEPWSGYEWVRYGDDALLIDVETGEVIRTEYDVFY